MARQYSPKKFLRQAPNRLLRRYLAAKGIGNDIQWNDMPESGIDPIFNAIDAASETVHKEIDTDFREIEALADEGGVMTIIEEGRDQHHKLNLAPIFEGMGEALECAFWTFLEHPRVFEVARRLDYADGISFEKRPHLPPVEVIPNEESKQRLHAALSDYYRREQGKGRGCNIDLYRRGDRYYYFCFLEDYAKTSHVFTDHVLKIEKHTPAFEVIIIYNPTERTLESKVRGGSRVRLEVERIFGRAVLNVDLGEPVAPGIAYDLSGLLQRDCNLSPEVLEGIEKVALRRLKLRIMGKLFRHITLEVGANDHEKAIWDLYDATMAGSGISKDLLTVVQAGIRVVFRADKKGKSKARPFSVSSPNTCTLKSDPKDEVIKECLKRWKIDVSGSDDYTAPQSRLDAQYRLWP